MNTPRWYMLNKMGMATLCASKADAEKEAADAQRLWPHMGPHRAVQLVEAADVEAMRAGYEAARLEIESLRARNVAPAGGDPALPDAAGVVVEHVPVGGGWVRHERRQSYTADQMRAYADETCATRAAQPEVNIHCRSTQKRLATQWGFVPAGAQQPGAVAGPAKTSSIFALRTEPEKGESQWAGIYSNRADAEHDAEVMRSATGREWHVVTLAEASSATVPSTTTEAAAHEWRVSHTYGGEICANCGAVKGTRRGNAPCGEAAAPTTQPAPQQEAQEPVMIYHGGCTIDCGEHGHHNVELLRMIPAGSKLYTAPKPSPASQGDALDAACQRACMELPEGMSMAIQLERDAGWVELHGSYGDHIELPNADGSLAEQVHQAIDAARAAQEGKNHG